MKHFRISLPALLMIFFLFHVSCTKKGASPAPDGPEKPTAPVTPPNPASPTTPTNPRTPTNPTNPTKKVLTPQGITTDNLNVEFKYSVTGNRLTEIRQSNGTREMILYHDNGFPKEYQRLLKDELIYHVYYVTNADGLVIKAIQYAVASGGKAKTLFGNYQISYGDHLEIKTIEWYDFTNMLTSSREHKYNDDLQLISSQSAVKTSTLQSFQYDGSEGIFKHVPHAQLIAIEHPAFYMLNQKLNLQSIKHDNHATEDLRFEMQYNVDGYPSAITQINAANNQKTFKITYR